MFGIVSIDIAAPEHLISAEFVDSDGGGDVAPEGAAVQIDVERSLAERGQGNLQRGTLVWRVGAFDSAALVFCHSTSVG